VSVSDGDEAIIFTGDEAIIFTAAVIKLCHLA